MALYKCCIIILLLLLSNDRHPRTSADGWYPVLPAAMSAMYSVLSDCHGLKKLQCDRNEWCYELCRLGRRTVCWFQNWNWKSTFIKHAHYAQLTTLEGRISVWLSASTVACKVVFESVCRCAKSLQMHLRTPPASCAHLWTFITRTPVIQHKGNMH